MTYGLSPVQGLNLGHSSVKQSELRRDESDALDRWATVAPIKKSIIIMCMDYTIWVTGKRKYSKRAFSTDDMYYVTR